MIVTIQPSGIKGTVQAPTSKSSMQRACAAALLATGVTQIHHPGNSNDDLAALDTIQKLGATVVHTKKGSLTIHSKGVHPTSGEIDCGESGLGIRMFTPIAALSKKEIVINGSGSLATRPMHFFDDIFPQLNISILSNNGRLPLRIKGPLVPKNIIVDGSLSSQFLTGLLMAFGAAGATNVAITVKDLKSKPYIELTLQVMKQFGVEVENDNFQTFRFPSAPVGYRPSSYTVEGDWSGGAFLLVAGAIAGNISVKGLDIYSSQADKAIVQALMSSGAKVFVQEGIVDVGPGALKSFHFDATDCPDLFPPLVALASCCEGTTIIEGVNRLAFKESDRSLTLQEEFGKLGIRIELHDDFMTIYGSTGLKANTVHSHHDHRIAMACAVAGLRADGETSITEAEAINKSYPDFFEDLLLLGAGIDIQTAAGKSS
ncbi:MAG: 3-phosphoshikimate 1-carboxyvinyltransferase [Chitinophagaceae bacterium]